jgi:hypothetical protein
MNPGLRGERWKEIREMKKEGDEFRYEGNHPPSNFNRRIISEPHTIIYIIVYHHAQWLDKLNGCQATVQCWTQITFAL